jgi:uncharacterized membrane protein YjjB (DUF3815 family)
MSLLSYLGSKLAPICTVLARSLVLIYTELASSSTLKAPNIKGITGLSGVMGNRRLISLSSTVATTVAASLMSFCSQSNARYSLASMVITPLGPGIFNFW